MGHTAFRSVLVCAHACVFVCMVFSLFAVFLLLLSLLFWGLLFFT